MGISLPMHIGEREPALRPEPPLIILLRDSSHLNICCRDSREIFLGAFASPPDCSLSLKPQGRAESRGGVDSKGQHAAKAVQGKP